MPRWLKRIAWLEAAFHAVPCAIGPSAAGDWWFGGGTDITPAYVDEEDMRHFHGMYKKVCGPRHSYAGPSTPPSPHSPQSSTAYRQM